MAGLSDARTGDLGRRIGYLLGPGGDRRRADTLPGARSRRRSCPLRRGSVSVTTVCGDLDSRRALYVALAVAHRRTAAGRRARRRAGRRDAGGVSQRRPLAGRRRRAARVGGFRHRRARGGALAVGARHRPAGRAGADAWRSGPHRRRRLPSSTTSAVDLRRSSRACTHAAAAAAGARARPQPLLGPPRSWGELWTIGGAQSARVASATARLGAPARAQRRLDRDRAAIRGRVDRPAGRHRRRGRTLACRRDSAGAVSASSKPRTTAARPPPATSGWMRYAPRSWCSAAGATTATGTPRQPSWGVSAIEARGCSGRMRTGRWWWRRMGRR